MSQGKNNNNNNKQVVKMKEWPVELHVSTTKHQLHQEELKRNKGQMEIIMKLVF